MFGITSKWIGIPSTATILASQFLITPVSLAAGSSAVEAGKAIAFDRKKGNCLACHMIEGGAVPGNIAPPLIAIQGRFKSKQDLSKQIWDPTVNNPESSMPPFGKHDVLTKAELDKVVEFIWSL